MQPNTTKQPKKTAAQRRAKVRTVKATAAEPYEQFIENVHLQNPESTYLSQLIDPQYGDLRDTPIAGTQKSHTFRAHLVQQVGPDVNGRATAFCQPHPGGRLLQVSGKGTSSLTYTIKTKWTSTLDEQFLVPDPLGTISEATDSLFGGTIFADVEAPLCGLPGTDANRIWNPEGLHMQTRVCRAAGVDYCAVYGPGPSSIVVQFPNGLVSAGSGSPPALRCLQWDYTGTLLSTTSRTFVSDASVANGYYITTQSFTPSVGCSWIAFHLYAGGVAASLTAWGPTAANPGGKPNTEDILRVNLNGVQTAYAIERIPGYENIQPIVQRVRTVGLSLLGTNLSSDFNNGGFVAAGTLPGGTVGDPRFSWTAESLAALPDNNYNGPLKNGIYGYWAPETTLQAQMMQSPVPHERTLSLLPSLFAVFEFGALPEGATATPQVVRFETFAIVAATTNAQVLGPRRSPNAPAEVAMVLECISRTPRWTENPLHDKFVGTVKKAYDLVKKHGPAALSLAEKGVKYGKYLLPLLAAL